jgi:hypothetical protein
MSCNVCVCVCVVLCRVFRRAYVFANLGFYSHLAYRLLTSKYLDFLAVADLCQYEKVRVVDIYIYIDLSLLPPCWPILCRTPAHLNPPSPPLLPLSPPPDRSTCCRWWLH